MSEPVTSLLRWRVVKTFNAGNAEITNDLPTLHQAHIEVMAFQPGNPGSSALGSFTIKLHPPGSEGYAAAKAIYDQLDYFNRVEAYISADGASLGKLYYAGVVTQIRKSYGENPVFELSGHSDIVLANLSRPFPGEAIYSTYGGVGSPTDYLIAHSFLGGNELGFADTFNPFTSTNYTSTNLPGLTSGTWSGTTDNGLTVASCATGSGAALISKSGAAANDLRHHQYVEVVARIKPSTDASNAGKVGVGITAATTDCNNSLVAYVTAKYNSTTALWDLDVSTIATNGGVSGAATTVSNALTAAGDLEGFVSVTISYVATSGLSNVTVNGKVIYANLPPTLAGETDFGTATAYPFLFFGTPATGSATCYSTNLIQLTRYTDDLHSGIAQFKPGTIGTPAHSLPPFTTVDPTFLEVWARVAVREGWYWRYTPQAYTVGTRTIGTVDFTTDPGTDHGSNQSVAFSSSLGNLINLELTANGDQFASGTAASGPPSSDGGGIAYWRDIATMSKYGVLEDQILGIAPNAPELTRSALNIQSNRLNLGSLGSKTAVVLRDPQTADVWRELDKVMIHCPEMGINYLIARVVGYTFDENNPTQTLTLDQFGSDDPTLLSKRMQTSLWQASGRFAAR